MKRLYSFTINDFFASRKFALLVDKLSVINHRWFIWPDPNDTTLAVFLLVAKLA